MFSNLGIDIDALYWYSTRLSWRKGTSLNKHPTGYPLQSLKRLCRLYKKNQLRIPEWLTITWASSNSNEWQEFILKKKILLDFSIVIIKLKSFKTTFFIFDTLLHLSLPFITWIWDKILFEWPVLQPIRWYTGCMQTCTHMHTQGQHIKYTKKKVKWQKDWAGRLFDSLIWSS